MTVNPGWGGQAFIRSRRTRSAACARFSARTPQIEVDGGVDVDTAGVRGGGRDVVRRRLGDLRRRRPGAAYARDRGRGRRVQSRGQPRARARSPMERPAPRRQLTYVATL